MILTSTLAFSFMHIVLLNWIAPLFTLVGGLLFAATYRRSRSLLTAGFEHALFGCFNFTLGLGVYFYNGARFGPGLPSLSS
jgi:membrane protease YdiL (CAAX protease family)